MYSEQPAQPYAGALAARLHPSANLIPLQKLTMPRSSLNSLRVGSPFPMAFIPISSRKSSLDLESFYSISYSQNKTFQELSPNLRFTETLASCVDSALTCSRLGGDRVIIAVTCIRLDVLHGFPFFLGSEHLWAHNCNSEKRRPSELRAVCIIVSPQPWVLLPSGTLFMRLPE